MKSYSCFITILELLILPICTLFINLLYKYTPKSRITKDKFKIKPTEKRKWYLTLGQKLKECQFLYTVYEQNTEQSQFSFQITLNPETKFTHEKVKSIILIITLGFAKFFQNSFLHVDTKQKSQQENPKFRIVAIFALVKINMKIITYRFSSWELELN